VLEDDRDLVGEGRVVGAAVRDVAGQQVRMAVLVLEPFPVEGGAAGGGAEQEAPGAHVGGLPGRIAHALEAEHRVEDVERQHRHVVAAVAGGGGHPAGETAGLVDAFLQHLAGRVLAVEHQLVGVDRLVLLAVRRVDADLPEQPFHAEGARLVADDRYRARADRLVAQDHVQRLHEGHGGADLAVAAALQQALERRELGRRQRLAGLGAALRQRPAEGLAARLEVLHFRGVRAGVVERHLGQLLVGDRDVEAVAEGANGRIVQLLLLVGDVDRLAGLAHAVALHRLGEDHGRLALVVHRGVVGSVDLVRVVAAAVQAPDVLVGQRGDHLLGFLVLAEEVLARVGAAEGLAVLVLAVDGLHHQLPERAVGVLGEQRVPVAAPDELEHVPAGATELALQFLDDLAVATHRAVEALQVAVDDEDQVVEALAAGQRDRTEALGLVAFAVAEEAPDLAVGHRHQAACLQVLPEARLVDGGDRAQTHRHRRRLPEVGHQPGVRVAGDAKAVHLAAVVVDLLLGQAAFEEGAGVDAGRTVALDVQKVARMAPARRAPEVVEADVVERGRRSEAGDVPAQFARPAVGAHHHGQRVPADQRAQPPLQLRVPRALGLEVRRDGVDVLGGRYERQVRPGAAGQFDHALQQLVRALRAVGVDHRLQRFQPLPGLDGVDVVRQDVLPPVHAMPPALEARPTVGRAGSGADLEPEV